jgi:hypothetical protein
VKHLSADDSVHSHVKVGHRQAPLSKIQEETPKALPVRALGFLRCGFDAVEP